MLIMKVGLGCIDEHFLLLMFDNRLRPSGRYGNTGVENNSCQTWNRWKIGEACNCDDLHEKVLSESGILSNFLSRVAASLSPDLNSAAPAT